ncbi:MAG: hypothetical protein Fur0041_10240 [Bacteroidia bacterium]
MRIAVVDLGTNTFNLLIAEIPSGARFQTFYSEKLPVRLGEGGINKGYIAEAAYLRGLEAMDNYASTCRQFNADKILAFATSAVRNASNGKQFAEDVLQRTGISIQIIDGAKEAEYIYKGVAAALQFNETHSLIIDIGGGSTEFIIASKDGLKWKQSFEIGASRLLQKFTPSDPISAEEVQRIEEYLTVTLQPMFEAARAHEVNELIGASGSFESLADMVVARFHPEQKIDHATEYPFNLEECEILHNELLRSTREERLHMKGLVAMRVDMIVISAILVEFIIRQLGIPSMRMSAYALKEGVLSDFLNAE